MAADQGSRRKKRGNGNGWEGWGGYMNAKIQKLQEQFSDGCPVELSRSDHGDTSTNIFSGISIFVNGYTNPTSDVLKRLMQTHGGVFHHYYSRQLVTHIIASNLPNNKINNIKDKKVVKPEWITESIAAGKLLPYQKFLLCKTQPSIQMGFVAGDSSVTPESSSVGQNPVCDTAVSEHKTQTPSIHNQANKQNITAESASVLEITKSDPSPSKSTKAGDPKFISEFYSHSRLHHLSTWGSEWKKYVNELRHKNQGYFPGREKLRSLQSDGSETLPPASGKQQHVIMHVDMDCFFVSVGLRNRPHLTDKPIAVTHSRGVGMQKNREGVDFEYERAHWRRHKDISKKQENDSTMQDGDSGDEDMEDVNYDGQDGMTSDQIKSSHTAVQHEETFHSMAEIASCNYAARKAGVKNGMFMGTAKKLCPDLETIPYDFEGYHQVSLQLYDTVASYTLDIEAVSCDEMLVDLTSLLSDVGVHPLQFAQILRDEIYSKTKCTASAGLGPNILLAKMATRAAKPNGQFHLPQNQVLDFIKDKLVKDLPGVGYSMTNKLQGMGVSTCGELRNVPLTTLQKEFGPKTGRMLYKYSLGQDDRPIKVEQERKSVSAEINYGIRFTHDGEGEKFLQELAEEVSSRLKAAGMKGKTVTLKLKVRSKDAPRETAKFMGHGICDNIAKSVTLPIETDCCKVIGKESWILLRALKIPPQDLRGIGIQVHHLKPAVMGHNKVNRMQSITDFTTKLQKKTENESESTSAQNKQKNPLRPTSEVTEMEETETLQRKNAYPPLPSLPVTSSPVVTRNNTARDSSPGHLQSTVTSHSVSSDDLLLPSQVDPAVLQELPADIRNEIENKMKTKKKAAAEDARCSRQHDRADEKLGRHSRQLDTAEEQPGCSHWTEPQHGTGLSDSPQKSTALDLITLPSPSQLDPTCLAALPPELQREIREEYKRQKQQQGNSKPKNALQLLRSPTKNSSPRKSPQKKVRTNLQFKVPFGRTKKQSTTPTKAKQKQTNQETQDAESAAASTEDATSVTAAPSLTEQENSTSINPVQTAVTDAPPCPHLCGAVLLGDVKNMLKEWIMSSSEPESEDLDHFGKYLQNLIEDKNLEQVDMLLRHLHRRVKQMECSKWTQGFDDIVKNTQAVVRSQYGSCLKLPF